MSEEKPLMFTTTKPVGGGDWVYDGGNVLMEHFQNDELVGQIVIRSDGVLIFNRIS